MNLKEVAELYTSYNLSTIAIGEKKIPQGKWRQSQFEIIPPNGNFDSAVGIGIVAGVVSGNLFVIDFDTKNDLPTENSWENFKKSLTKQQKEIVKGCLVEETPSFGRHLIYRVDGIIGGNEKFAMRPATREELLISPKTKALCTIESRSTGGYVQVAPTTGYKILNGSFAYLPVLTQAEHDSLVNTCKQLDQTNLWKIEPIKERQLAQQPKRMGVSTFDAYNQNADIPQFLEENGWIYVEKQGSNLRYRRPGTTDSRTSADWHEEMRLLHVFTSSTEFEPSKSYNAVQVYTTIKYGRRDRDTYKSAAKDMREMGYGDSFNEIEIQSQLRVEELDLNHLADLEEAEAVLDEIRKGEFAMGVGIGMQSLDDHWVYKVGQFNVINGHANVGKTTWLLWWFVMLSVKHGLNWILCSTENDTWEFIKMVIEFKLGRRITDLTDEEYKEAKKWANDHFLILNNDRTYTYKDILSIAQQEMKNKAYAGIMIDPFNGIEYVVEELKLYGQYTYHYRTANSYRMFCKKTLCSIYLVIHPQTNATRKTTDGKIDAPQAADAEYGNMWFNRSWNYVTAHRHTNADDWQTMYIWTRKIKNTFSGGKVTFGSEPIKLKMMDNKCGYVDEYGRNTKSLQNYYEKDEDTPTPF